MTKVIFARKGIVLSVTDTTFTAKYKDLLKPNEPPKVISLRRRLLSDSIQAGDTIVWECMLPSCLSRVVKYIPPKVVTVIKPDLTKYQPPKYLRQIAQVEATPSRRYFPLTHVDSNGKRRATGACLVVFVNDLMDLFESVGCDREQAVVLTANSYHETGGGAEVHCENYGGVKTKPSNVKGRGWFTKYGHVNSGDAPVVAYVDFLSPEDYAIYALNTFAPKPEPSEANGWPDVPRTDADYRPAGKAFWRVGGTPISEWYPRIIDAGYKGELTKTVEQRRKASIDSFNIICDTVRRLHANPFQDPKHLQSGLSFIGYVDSGGRTVPYYEGKIDGMIGPVSKTAISAFQRASGLPQTGSYTNTTGRTLLRQLRSAYPL